LNKPTNNIVSFRKAKSLRTAKRAAGKTLCTSGFHKWAVVKNSQFDVKQGKLVTAEQCTRCGLQRIKAT
jgi:hypothetical protein